MEIMEEFDKLFKMSYVSPSSSMMEQPKPKVVESKIDISPKKNFQKTLFRRKTMIPYKSDKKGNLDNSELDNKGFKTSTRKIEKYSNLSLRNETEDSKVSKRSSKNVDILKNADKNNWY